MGSMMKGNSRMDLASLTSSDDTSSNTTSFFDTKEGGGIDYVFIPRRPPSSSSSDHPASPHPHPDSQMVSAAPHSPPSPMGDDLHASNSPPGKCTLTYCCICSEGLPSSFQTPPTWSEVCRVAMYALEKGHQDRKYFHIRKEICPFIDAHYDILVPKTKSISWRQTVNMTLSHPQYAHIFMQESQDHEYGRRKGYYSLRNNVDLYRIPEPEKKSRRKRYFDDATSSKKRRKSEGEDGSPNNSDAGSSANNSGNHSFEDGPDHEGGVGGEAGEGPPEMVHEEEKKPTKGLIKKLETDLFLYFLEKKSLPADEENNNGDSGARSLPPLAPTPSPPRPSASASAAPVTPGSSSDAIIPTSSTAASSTAASSTQRSPSPLSPPPTLPPLSAAIIRPPLPSKPASTSTSNSSSMSSTNSTSTSSSSTSSASTKVSVTQLINDDQDQSASPLFPNWTTKSAGPSPSKNPPPEPNGINWSTKPTWERDRDRERDRERERDRSLNDSPLPPFHPSSSFQLPPSKSPFNSFPPNKYADQDSPDYPPHPQQASQYSAQSKFNLVHSPPPPRPAPPSPVLGKPAHYSQSHLSSPLHPHLSSQKGPWPYEPPQTPPYHQFSPQYTPPSPYSAHPQSPLYSHYPPYQKGPHGPSPHDHPHHSLPIHQYQPPNHPPPLQIHQSPLQQKQKSKSPQQPPSPPHSSPSPTPTQQGGVTMQSGVNLQTQQPQRRNRLTTRPWERAILEDYYVSFFCQSRHSRREKVKVDELVKKLGWEISRIQRWLDNRRTKDRPRFGHPEFGNNNGNKQADEAGEDQDDDDDKDDHDSPDSVSPPSSPNNKSSVKTPTSVNNNNNNKPIHMNNNITNNSNSNNKTPTPKKQGKKKASDKSDPSDGDEDNPAAKKKKTSPSPSPTAKYPPNPNHANTDFWVIKNK